MNLYKLRGPSFSMPDGPHKGRSYKHGQTYAMADIPETNRHWFEPAILAEVEKPQMQMQMSEKLNDEVEDEL